MPTSKKQMVKLNQVKKAKEEELSKQAAAGNQKARRSSRISRKSASKPPGISNYFYVLFLGLMEPKRAMQVATCSYLEGSGLHKGFVLQNMNP
jgi:hypothetical protein